MKEPENKSKGKLGESIAKSHVTKLGMEVLEENFRYKKGEIDIIAMLSNEILVFIEVKMRKGHSFGYPEEFVSRNQVRQIKKAAEHYIFAINWHKDIRFDIIAIEESTSEITYFPDAFY